ncbi:hypothetical protein DBR11_04910 [Pedobacter sp. HMWF019]|uniref:TonB-dependent receptor n=1 Tax=Pedobacter sp. HMWF019 TaxID=2056856 RepID=UPI000D391C61|nr:TonB-dependent receptor [Pedobacter sp. HMWF019]PTT02365.1 hypothetical protein DBR11_04910 [Pedobacter sp. HMWF019]
MRKLFVFILFYSIFSADAQTTISGTVSSKAEVKGLAGVSISVKEKNGTSMLNFVLTGDKGAYNLRFKSQADSVILVFSGFNLKKELIVVANKTQHLDFSMIPESIKLREVKVKLPEIRQLSDTLNYNVEAFSDKNDRTIGDVLKKMPGIRVNDNGSITYNNKPINKFYIESKDLLQGRYGLATNNIEFKDVATVQVLENHQPIKALKDKEFTDEGAINLKLKDAAKGVLVANAQLGAGLSPFLWNNELVSTYFDKNRQNINTYKGNNSGNNVAAELAYLYPGADPAGNQGGMLSIQSPSAPAISQKRYLFNQSHFGSVNQLWAYGKDLQLNANISYINDRQEKESYARSVYYLPGDSLLTIEEGLKAVEHSSTIETNLQLNANTDKYYLDNAFKLNGKWSGEEGTLQNIVQDLNKPVFKASNVFSLIRNYKKSTIRMYSSNAYTSNPQDLKVHPMLYPDLFPGAESSGFIKQVLRQGQFSSASKFVYGLDKGPLKQNYALGFNANIQTLNSRLQTGNTSGEQFIIPDSLRNSLNWNTFQFYLSPDYIYNKNRLRIIAGTPLVYTFLYSHNRITALEKKLKRLFFNPYVSIRYELSLLWNVSLSGRYGNELGGIESGLTGYLMSSYRSLVRNEGELPEQKKQYYDFNLSYRHPLHVVFWNLSASYIKNSMNLLYGYDYEGIRSLKESYLIPNVSESYIFFSRLSKGLDFLASTLALEIDYSKSKAAQISNGDVIGFTNQLLGLRPEISSKLGKWASLSYRFQYSRSVNRISADPGRFTPISNSIQRGQLNFFPASGLTLNLGLEHFYNSVIISGTKSLNFADAGIKYVFKRMEFNLEYTNILNARQYVSASYTDIRTFYTAYNLRPAQVLMKVRFKVK